MEFAQPVTSSVFKIDLWNFQGLLFVQYYTRLSISTRLGVIDNSIDEDNQWKHDSEFVKIIKYMFHIQFFMRNRSRMVSDIPEAVKSCSSTPTMSHKWIRHFLKNTWCMFYIQFFKKNRFGMVSDMSEASKACSSTPTTSTRPSPTMDFSWKIGYKACAMCVFGNMTYPLEGLSACFTFLKILRFHLWDSAWLTLLTTIGMTWRPLTILNFLIWNRKILCLKGGAQEYWKWRAKDFNFPEETILSQKHFWE